MHLHEETEPFLCAPKGKKSGKKIQRQPLMSFRFPVDVTAGSTDCTLGVLWRPSNLRFRIRVYEPDGTPLDARPNVRWVQGKYPYTFCVIGKPVTGTYQVEVLGDDIHLAKFRTIGFEVNNQIRFEVWPIESHIKAGSQIRLRARLLAPLAVPGVQLVGRVRRPDGIWKKFRFTEPPTGTASCGEGPIYNARVRSMPKQRGQYLITVDAYRKEGTFETKSDVFYIRKPGIAPSDPIQKVTVPRIRRRAFLTVTATIKGCSPKEPRFGCCVKSLRIPYNQQKLLADWKASCSPNVKKSVVGSGDTPTITSKEAVSV